MSWFADLMPAPIDVQKMVDEPAPQPAQGDGYGRPPAVEPEQQEWLPDDFTSSYAGVKQARDEALGYSTPLPSWASDLAPQDSTFQNTEQEVADVTPQGYGRLVLDEGERLKVYKDTKGIETIGVGFNLREPSNRQLFEQVAGFSADEAISGRQISRTVSRKLLEVTAARAEADVRSMVPSFDSYPAPVRDALVNFMFNVGKTTAGQFKNTFAAINRGDGKAAADGLRKSAYYKQVGARGERVALALEQLGKAPATTVAPKPQDAASEPAGPVPLTPEGAGAAAAAAAGAGMVSGRDAQGKPLPRGEVRVFSDAGAELNLEQNRDAATLKTLEELVDYERAANPRPEWDAQRGPRGSLDGRHRATAAYLQAYDKRIGLPEAIKNELNKRGGVTAKVFSDIEGKAYSNLTAESVLKHPDLFKTYPELRAVPVEITWDRTRPQWGGTAVSKDRKASRFVVNAHSEEDARTILLHEINHGAQLADGRQSGGSPFEKENIQRWNLDNLTSKERTVIDKLAGEAGSFDEDGVPLRGKPGVVDALMEAGIIPDVGGDDDRAELKDKAYAFASEDTEAKRAPYMVEWVDKATGTTRQVSPWELLAWHDLKNGGNVSQDTLNAVNFAISDLEQLDEPAPMEVETGLKKLKAALEGINKKSELPSSYKLYRLLEGEVQASFTESNSRVPIEKLKDLLGGADTVSRTDFNRIAKALLRLVKR